MRTYAEVTTTNIEVDTITCNVCGQVSENKNDIDRVSLFFDKVFYQYDICVDCAELETEGFEIPPDIIPRG